MTNVKVDIGDSYIAIRVDYKITKSITTNRGKIILH